MRRWHEPNLPRFRPLELLFVQFQQKNLKIQEAIITKATTRNRSLRPKQAPQAHPPKKKVGVSLLFGCFRKWWYPQNTPTSSFLVGKPWKTHGCWVPLFSETSSSIYQLLLAENPCPLWQMPLWTWILMPMSTELHLSTSEKSTCTMLWLLLKPQEKISKNECKLIAVASSKN